MFRKPQCRLLRVQTKSIRKGRNSPAPKSPEQMDRQPKRDQLAHRPIDPVGAAAQRRGEVPAVHWGRAGMGLVCEHRSRAIHHGRSAAALATAAILLVRRQFARRADHAFLGNGCPLFSMRHVDAILGGDRIQLTIRLLQHFEFPPIGNHSALRARISISQLAQLGQVSIALQPGIFDRAVQHPRTIASKP